MNKILTAILTAIVFVIFSGPAAAQSRGGKKKLNQDVLVAANPPLTRTQVNQAIAFFEWMLKAEFDAEQRARFQTILVEGWKQDAKISARAFNEINEIARKVEALAPERRAEIQPQMQESFFENMKRSPDSELYQLLIEIYQEANRKADADTNAETSGSVPKSLTSPQSVSTGLVGEWTTDTQGLSLFRSGAKDVFASSGSAIRSFKFYPDGRVEFAAFFTQSLSICVTKIFRTGAGRFTSDGDNLILNFAAGKVQSQNNCDSKLNYTKAIETERQKYTFSIEDFNGGLKLCLLDENNASYCLYKN